MPETVYNRKPIAPNTGNERDRKSSEDRKSMNSDRDVGQSETVVPPLMSYRESLQVFTGTYATDESAWMTMWRPFALLGSPTVLVRLSIHHAPQTSDLIPNISLR